MERITGIYGLQEQPFRHVKGGETGCLNQNLTGCGTTLVANQWVVSLTTAFCKSNFHVPWTNFDQEKI